MPQSVARLAINWREAVYDALVVANGHHWDSKILPNTATDLNGIQIHSHAYDSPFEPMTCEARIFLLLVLALAMDIASEVSQKPIAAKCFVSARRGVWVPKYLNGEPADKAVMPAWVPTGIARWLGQRVVSRAIGNMENYGLPRPDHKVLTAHPSVSGEFLTRLGCGDISVKPGLDCLDGDGVIFTDGSREEVDVIIGRQATASVFRFSNKMHWLSTITVFRSIGAW